MDVLTVVVLVVLEELVVDVDVLVVLEELVDETAELAA